MGWFVSVDPAAAQAEQEAYDAEQDGDGVLCAECGVDDGTRGSENLCEDCAFLWLSRRQGRSVH